MGMRENCLGLIADQIRSCGSNVDPQITTGLRALGYELFHAQSFIFDQKSGEVIDELLQETTKNRGALPWPNLPFDRLFLEIPIGNSEEPGGSRTLGILLSKGPGDTRSIVVASEQGDGKILQPQTRVTFDRDEAFHVSYPFGGDDLNQRFMNKFGVDQSNLEDVAFDTAIGAYLMVAIFAELHSREGMFLAREESSLSRQQRRQAERQGKMLPDRTVMRISLDELGHRHLEAIKGPLSKEGEGQGTKRAHWVRGHIFLARNGVLTWRKPHIRGIGPVLPKERHVVAPAEEEEDPSFSP